VECTFGGVNRIRTEGEPEEAVMIRTITGFAAALAAIAIGSPAVAAATGPVPAPRPAQAAHPAQQRPETPARSPKAELKLTYMAESGYATAVTLTCAPAGGGHPRPARACATLKSTGVDPDRIRPARVMCLMLYAPITAEVTGVWRGRPVTWTHRYGNSCEMTRATGILFRF
jgi:hypothetical protein